EGDLLVDVVRVGAAAVVGRDEVRDVDEVGVGCRLSCTGVVHRSILAVSSAASASVWSGSSCAEEGSGTRKSVESAARRTVALKGCPCHGSGSASRTRPAWEGEPNSSKPEVSRATRQEPARGSPTLI